MVEVLYDTSTLIELYKRKDELKGRGYTTILNVVEFPKALEIKGLRIVYPNPEDYKLAIVIAKNLLKAGKPVPAIDIVVAAIAVNRRMGLLTKNRHFQLIKEVENKLLLDIK